MFTWFYCLNEDHILSLESSSSWYSFSNWSIFKACKIQNSSRTSKQILPLLLKTKRALTYTNHSDYKRNNYQVTRGAHWFVHRNVWPEGMNIICSAVKNNQAIYFYSVLVASRNFITVGTFYLKFGPGHLFLWQLDSLQFSHSVYSRQSVLIYTNISFLVCNMYSHNKFILVALTIQSNIDQHKEWFKESIVYIFLAIPANAPWKIKRCFLKNSEWWQLYTICFVLV